MTRDCRVCGATLRHCNRLETPLTVHREFVCPDCGAGGVRIFDRRVEAVREHGQALRGRSERLRAEIESDPDRLVADGGRDCEDCGERIERPNPSVPKCFGCLWTADRPEQRFRGDRR